MPSNNAFYWLYDPLLLGFCLSQLPGFLLEYFTTDKYREDLKQRFGYYSPKLQKSFTPGQTAWIHAVSVGEVAAAAPVIKDLSFRYPNLNILISTVTRTGREMAQKSKITFHQNFFLPFDFRPITERALEQINPRFLLLTDTEIWPNLIRSAHKRNIPIMTINGRISSNSFKNYRMVKGLFRSVLDQITLFGMQSKRDAERILQLGAKKERVFITGNLKFDQADIKISREEKKQLAQQIHLPPEHPLFIAGSTHPGENTLIIETYQKLLNTLPKLVLLIAPRHLTTIPEIEDKCRQTGLFSQKKTQIQESQKATNKQGRVIILDTIGELSKIYSLATVVFVGGSFVPIGGHNLLEPAAYGKPVLFGPYLDNFREISLLLMECGGGFKAENKKELEKLLRKLLIDQKLQKKAGEAAHQAVKENQGATDKTLTLIETYLMTS